VVVCALYQSEMPSCVESTANDIPFPSLVSGGHMKPVVVLEKLDLAR